jgi:hypothetical protein
MRRAELAGLCWTDVDLYAARLSPRRPRVAVNYVVNESDPRPGWGSGPGRWIRWPPSRSTRLARSRNAPTSGRRGSTRGWSSLGRTAPPSTRTSSPIGSGGWPAPPACRQSGCMTCATATPPPRSPPTSRQGGQRAPWPRHHRHHPGRLQPRHPRHGRSGRQCCGQPHPRGYESFERRFWQYSPVPRAPADKGVGLCPTGSSSGLFQPVSAGLVSKP